MSISENLSEVMAEIHEAEKKAGRKDGSVKLLAVSKFHPEESAREALKWGQKAFGENRVQEAYEKFTSIYKDFPETELHIIGSLQTNKVKKACEIASVIESVDRLSLIKEIEKQCSKLNKKIQVFFELHTAEDSKSGYESFESLEESLKFIHDGNTPHIIPKGFMTMAPFSDDEKLVRKSFVTLRETSEKLKKEFPDFPLTELSMGMSGDFRLAIEEGSTIVRIGTRIFGERDYSNK